MMEKENQHTAMFEKPSFVHPKHENLLMLENFSNEKQGSTIPMDFETMTKHKGMPGKDDAEAKALENAVKKAMEEATKPFKDNHENLKLEIKETEGNNEAIMTCCTKLLIWKQI
uniref:Uncharacterized protein n=1 Tax=Romanomermis culicivorax TaxID=13658 RepID=A0A915JT25_ROMCU